MANWVANSEMRRPDRRITGTKRAGYLGLLAYERVVRFTVRRRDSVWRPRKKSSLRQADQNGNDGRRPHYSSTGRLSSIKAFLQPFHWHIDFPRCVEYLSGEARKDLVLNVGQTDSDGCHLSAWKGSLEGRVDVPAP